MVRKARIVIADQPHHITQRGNNKELIFYDDYDRKKYLLLISEYAEKFSLRIVAYCLMDNHVHFIVVPHSLETLSKNFHAVNLRYAQYFNNKTDRIGHLWEGRFYSCFLNEKHLVAALRYVERNPCRKKIVRKPWEWPWSSASEHTGRSKSLIKLDEFRRYLDVSCSEWEKFIDEEEKKELLGVIRKHTRNG